MTPHNDLLCALCGDPIPSSHTRIVLNGQRFHPTCAIRYDLDMPSESSGEVVSGKVVSREPEVPPHGRTLVATLFMYFAWGALAGLLVAGSLGVFAGWCWRLW